MSQIVQTFDEVRTHAKSMKKSELTVKQISTVDCPTCGASAGERCVLNSGLPRSEPHVDRKFAALKVLEEKSIQII